MNLIRFFRNRRHRPEQQNPEKGEKGAVADPVMEEVELFCQKNSIDSEDLKSRILELARIQDIKNYIAKVPDVKPVMVVANGPGFDIHEIPNGERDGYVFCFMNNSPLSPIFWEIKPEYYIQADPLFFQETVTLEANSMTIEKLKREVSWDVTFFVPYRHYERTKVIYSSNPRLHITPFHDLSFSVHANREDRNLMYRLGLDAPIVQNVLVGAIYCMINSGYKHIELYGANHSWTTQLVVNDNNEVCLKDEHFFDKKEVEFKPWHKVSGPVYKMHEILRDLAQMFDSYWILKDYADSEGVKIINKTEGSFIDAFDRK